MDFEPELLSLLAGFPVISFSGDVFRVSRRSADPLAPSISGGRWSPAATDDRAVQVLYTSLEPDGAIAEVASYLSLLTPRPLAQALKLCRLAVATKRSLQLVQASMVDLGIDVDLYGSRDYRRTQQIGLALFMLGRDGLIAPSARWPCDNLILFSDHHQGPLRVAEEREFDWQQWAREHDLFNRSQ